MLDSLRDLLHAVYDVKHLIQWGGLSLICAIVFVETGLFAGFFLPGDSLLVSAGIFARAGYLSLPWLLLLVPVCAIVGDQVGYLIGRKLGAALFRREDSLFFHKKHLVRTQEFYERYGTKTIVLARFVPIVRTFAPVVAGIAQMEYGKFVTYNVVGGLVWSLSMILGGYSLASLIPDIEKRIHLVIVVVVFLSVLPGLFEFLRERRRARAAQSA